MPLSPSMNVMLLLQHEVFMKAGSYVIRPKSSGWTLILRRSMARMVSCSMGSSYVLSLRLSVMVTESLGMTLNSFWAYLASLPVAVSDLDAAGLVSLEDFESDTGADEELLPFPLVGAVLDFFA